MIDLSAIRAALAAATPGPWHHCGDDTYAWIEADNCGQRCHVVGPHADGPCADDAELIAHAPAWLAELVAEVDRLRADFANACDAGRRIEAEGRRLTGEADEMVFALRAENERLRKVLSRLLSAYDDTYNEDPESQMAVADARAALDGAK